MTVPINATPCAFTTLVVIFRGYILLLSGVVFLVGVALIKDLKCSACAALEDVVISLVLFILLY
jgi:hypothetical protein